MGFVQNTVLHLPSRLRAGFYRICAPVFYERVGRGCRIHRGQRFGRLFTRASIGARTVIKYDVYLQTSRSSVIEIGDRCMINTGCHIVATERISIGAGTAIGEYTSIRDQDHIMDQSNGVRGSGFRSAPVTIGKDVWIGRGAYIGAGTVLGDGCVVGANSVVHGEFPAGAVVVGAPAVIKKIRERPNVG